ncbi:AIDA repeat-containing protein [Escherichia coli]
MRAGRIVKGAFSIHNHVADNVLLENGGHLDINIWFGKQDDY